jgi:hypothetical protein
MSTPAKSPVEQKTTRDQAMKMALTWKLLMLDDVG